MSDDYTSQMIQWIMDQSAGGQFLDPGPYEGKPAGVSAEMARRVNLYQDQLSTQSDMANAALMGPAAFAPGAFDSTSSYTPIDQEGISQLRALARRTNTPAGMIADGILNGQTAGSMIAQLQQMYTEAEADGSLEGDPLLSLIPKKYDDVDGTTMVPDWQGLTDQMTDVEMKALGEAQSGGSGALYDPQTGEYLGGGNRRTVLDENNNPVLVDVETTPSEAAQWYADQGLSPPDQQYQFEDLVDPGLMEQYSQIAGLDEQSQQAYLDWLGTMPQPATPPTGKDQLMGDQAAEMFTKPGSEPPAPGGGGGGGAGGGGWDSMWSGIGDNLGNFQDRLAETPIANTNGLPPMVNAAVTAAQLAPDAGSWWARNGASPQEAVTGIAGGLGGFINDVWNSYAGNDESFGRQFGNEQFDAEGNPVQWDPNASYETAFNDRVAQILAERGATAPPQGQDPTGLISDESWAASQARPPLDWGPEPGIQDQNGNTVPAGGGSNGQYGFQMPPQMLQQLMPQSLIQGLAGMPQGGNPPGGPPPAPTPGPITNDGTVRNPSPLPPQYNTPGQAPADPTSSGPPMPTQTQVDPQLQAMLALIMGGGMDANTLAGMQQQSSAQSLDDFENQRNEMFNSTPQLSENDMLPQSEQVGRGVYSGASDAYVPQQQGAVGSSPSLHITANGVSGGPYVSQMADRQAAPPTLEELLQIMGQQQGRNPYNVSGMNVGLNGMGGGITAPPLANPNPNQDDYLPQSEQAGRGTAVEGDLSDRLGTTSQAPEDQWWYHNIFDHPSQDDYLPQSEQTGRGTAVGGALSDRLGTTSNNPPQTGLPQSDQPGRGTQAQSWWAQTFTGAPSWWQQTMGNSSYHPSAATNSSGQQDQQVRIGKQRPTPREAAPGRPGQAGSRGSFKPAYTPTAEQQRGADEYMRVYHQRQEQNRRAGIGSGAYGRAAAVAYLLQQQGITPSSTQLAARRGGASSAGMGM